MGIVCLIDLEESQASIEQPDPVGAGDCQHGSFRSAVEARTTVPASHQAWPVSSESLHRHNTPYHSAKCTCIASQSIPHSAGQSIDMTCAT